MTIIPSLSKYGPWAVITGASDGIGRECARTLAANGMNLLLVARRYTVLEDLASELRGQFNADVRIAALDLSDPSSIDAVVHAARDIDVGLLVAAAGFGTSGPFVELPVEEELAMIDVNCRAVVSLSHAFASRFVSQRRGGIVLFSSLLAFQGVARSATYAATKAFVQTFAEGLTLEVHAHGVDVVVAAPGPTQSGFGARAEMRMTRTTSAETVAFETLRALGRTTLVRPGMLSRVLEWALAPLSRKLRSRILSQIMLNMTQHHSRRVQPERPAPV